MFTTMSPCALINHVIKRIAVMVISFILETRSRIITNPIKGALKNVSNTRLRNLFIE